MAEDVQILDEGIREQTKSGDLLADIDNVVDKTLQIYELTSKEGDIIESIGSSMSILLSTLKVSMSLPQTIFQNEFPSIKSAVLNANAEIIIMQANGNIVTKKFSELDSTQVVDIMKETIPKLNQSAEERKTEVTEKIATLKKVAKQFQRVKGMSNSKEDDE